ncbi:transposase [Paenibacillus ihbetae]|uniref:Transposase n=1 Tax=Paenibacillus ihbetae TaxID=1870820 RepID=A0A1B2DZD9_9BACL|nr:transposase [Paenibacillus ihbetae]ANY73108.1 transposase [Paenibacillus ihbetae]OOC59018.1 transposase [Paenibacillus ihbetae]
MAGKDKDLPPISRDEVEVDGIYTNEWGREEYLKRGETFPFDPQNGSTEWKLSEYDFENHHQGRTDERLVPKKKGPDKQVNIDSPFRHVEID